MSNKYDGGPAFPFITPLQNIQVVEAGMTLRDYFAGQALAGLCAGCVEFPNDNAVHRGLAYNAYKSADAMIAERNKENS